MSSRPPSTLTRDVNSVYGTCEDFFEDFDRPCERQGQPLSEEVVEDLIENEKKERAPQGIHRREATLFRHCVWLPSHMSYSSPNETTLLYRLFSRLLLGLVKLVTIRPWCTKLLPGMTLLTKSSFVVQFELSHDSPIEANLPPATTIWSFVAHRCL